MPESRALYGKLSPFACSLGSVGSRLRWSRRARRGVSGAGCFAGEGKKERQKKVDRGRVSKRMSCHVTRPACGGTVGF